MLLSWLLASTSIGLFFGGMAVSAGEAPDTLEETGDRYLMLVVGAPGQEEYKKAFSTWAERWRSAAQEGGMAYTTIGEDDDEPTSDELEDVNGGGTSENGGGASDKAALKSALGKAVKTGRDPLWLVLIGHGTFDGKHAKFNLEGPDFSANELAGWLEPYRRPLLVVNCSSASGPFINRLSGTNRVIVTATKSGYEQNYARFGKFLSQAINGTEADLDRDRQVSLLEAFIQAAGKTTEFYESEGRLVTEHALLDDNGDGYGTPAEWFRGIYPAKQAEEDRPVDGLRAHQLHLVPSEQEMRLSADQRATRNRLEREIYRLRKVKNKLEEDDYYDRLEPLLVELARLYERSEQSEE